MQTMDDRDYKRMCINNVVEAINILNNTEEKLDYRLRHNLPHSEDRKDAVLKMSYNDWDNSIYITWGCDIDQPDNRKYKMLFNGEGKSRDDVLKYVIEYRDYVVMYD